MNRRGFLKNVLGSAVALAIAPTAISMLPTIARPTRGFYFQQTTIHGCMMTKEDWIQIDRSIIRAARRRLRSFAS